jgi:hypothetical protein
MAGRPSLDYTRDDLAPSDALGQLIAGHQVTWLIHVAARLGLADLLGDGTLAATELAELTATHPPTLYRLLRALASVGILRRVADGGFGLTDVGRFLRTDVAGSLRAVALFSGEESFQRSWSGLLDAVRTGAPAFDHVFGMSLAAYLGEHPAASRHFDKRATGNTARVADRVAASYDFRRVRRLVDVGGGYGTLSAAILKMNPDLRGVVFDQPHVVEGARRYLAAAGVAERCTAVGGSFFEQVPAGGDLYVLKSVLHDWDDDRALAILATCRTAMADGGTLLLVERIIPADDEPSCEVALYDLMMLVLSGGRERTVAEYEALLARSGLALTRVISTPSSFSILEAMPCEESRAAATGT